MRGLEGGLWEGERGLGLEGEKGLWGGDVVVVVVVVVVGEVRERAAHEGAGLRILSSLVLGLVVEVFEGFELMLLLL